MAFNLYYYESKMICNYCKKEYSTYKVRPGRYKVIAQDTDFMPIYEGINPLLYEVAVCPHCGYAYHKSMTRTYGPFMLLIGEIYINQLQKIMNLCKERTIDEAIASYKLAYLVARASMEETIILANFALKIAWLYRLKQDKELEMRYLRSARELFNKSHANNKEGEERMQYLIAEISLRLGDIEEAKRGFSRLITSREVSNKYRNYARKRWEEYKYENQAVKEQEG
ncbi:DUF2225 domain-containing protein [Ureibacillus thermosphaericus]|uniref:DUF2225 domain-containing protein n=1 Tax=Ureibacillus thermosphaericus TaxID=51173 RepID=A0A840PV69_URETH|nr:DUF2225 domain-containing protein [Ureibacillus thermosphaericus]MBB5150339.1 hypothetical protein [Ureibacillus thermosphaericus]NKZ32932.1 DUF2225 domain-containing protein [Ureibacillus thermosphaericus]